MDLDLRVKGGTVVDGTGGPSRRADVGIVGDRIVAVGDLAAATAQESLDATGRLVCPGFIDAHVHSEGALAVGDQPRGAPEAPPSDGSNAEVDRFGSLVQGVTTHLMAPDGWGVAPLDADGADALWRAYRYVYPQAWLRRAWPDPGGYLAAFTGRTPVNLVPQVPHMAVRFAAMGWADRPASPAELDAMRSFTRAWLDAGAGGLNAGLDYEPATASTTDELVELARLVGERGGVFAAHVRYLEVGREAAIREAFEVGRRAGVPVSVSHETVDAVVGPLLDEAARDLDVSFDSYLYPAGSGHLLYLLPREERAGGNDGVLERLADPAAAERIAAYYEAALAGGAARGATISATRSGRDVGLTLEAAAERRGLTVGRYVVELMKAELPDVLMIYGRRSDGEPWETVYAQTARHPAMLVSSDGIYHGQRPHPRGYGSYARFLRVAVRERSLLSVEEAVAKMTSRIADVYRLRDRGRVRVGAAADVVVVDPGGVADRATWEEPRLPPVGIDAVVVNGRLAVSRGRPTGVLAGRVIRPLA